MELMKISLNDIISSNPAAMQTYLNNLRNGDETRVWGYHHVIVRDEKGKIVRDDIVKNLVTTVGKNAILTASITGGAQITTWYMGLIAENRHVNDGVISGQPTTTLSSATASFGSGDVGRQITVYGGGASGANFAGTIISQTGTACVVSSNLQTNGTGLTVSIGPLFNVADTSASHAGWTEVPSADFTNSVRVTWSAGAPSGGSTTGGTNIVYTMATISTVYIHGLFIISDSTLGGTTGTLLSEAEYGGSTPGAIIVQTGYTIADTYTLTLS